MASPQNKQTQLQLIISNFTWPAIWVTLNVILALLNKYVYSLGFDFPIMLSAIHMVSIPKYFMTPPIDQ